MDQSQGVERDAFHRPVCRSAEVFIVYPSLLGVHGHEGIADNIFNERTSVDGMESSSERFCLWIAEHHKLVAREGLVKVKFVRRGLVADELLVSKRRF